MTGEAKAQSQILPKYLLGFWDGLANWLILDRDGVLYNTGRKIAITIGSDVELETGAFYSHVKGRLTENVADSLADSLTQVATQRPISQLRHVESQVADFSRAKTLLLAEASAASKNNSLNKFFNAMNLSRLSGQPAKTVRKSLSEALAENIADIMVNGSAARNPLASLIRENKPIIAQTLRATVNSFLNENILQMREGFNMPSWVAMYQTQWCWGHYTRKGHKTVAGCADGSALEDLNLAPGLQRTLNNMNFHWRMPERVDLPTGMQKSLDGMEQFTHAVYAAIITLVVLTGLTFLVSLLNVFVPEKWTQASDFFTLGLCAASGAFIMLVGAPYAVFEYFAGLTMPGLASLLNIGYEGGWRFVALLISAEVMTLIGMGYWIVLERKGYHDKMTMETIVIAKRDTRMMGLGNMDQTIKFGT